MAATIENLPEIPSKRYFAIGEVSDLCGVKAHVLRYWEQEFPQLKPNKRRGNRRYYQRDDVLMIRRIRSLLHEEGYSIAAARSHLREIPRNERLAPLLPRIAPPTAVPIAATSRAEQLRRLREEAEALLTRWPN